MSDYDIIGDVHGYATLLIKLLKQLGYEEKEGTFIHPHGNKVIFVGDLINRGPETVKVLQLVRRMHLEEQAYAVIGNHEFRLLQKFTKYPSLIESNITEFIPWIQSLPLFLEFPYFRVVHAAWHFASIEKLRDQNLKDVFFIRSTFDPQSEHHKAINLILRGITAPIPNYIKYYDRFGVQRRLARVRWWEKSQNKIKGANFFPKCPQLMDIAFENKTMESTEPYKITDKPVFFGHYCLPPQESKVINNLVCLDGCVTCDQVLWAYQFKNDQKISTTKLVRT
jgi:hypothetical protein